MSLCPKSSRPVLSVTQSDSKIVDWNQQPQPLIRGCSQEHHDVSPIPLHQGAVAPVGGLRRFQNLGSGGTVDPGAFARDDGRARFGVDAGARQGIDLRAGTGGDPAACFGVHLGAFEGDDLRVAVGVNHGTVARGYLGSGQGEDGAGAVADHFRAEHGRDDGVFACPGALTHEDKGGVAVGGEWEAFDVRGNKDCFGHDVILLGFGGKTSLQPVRITGTRALERLAF